MLSAIALLLSGGAQAQEHRTGVRVCDAAEQQEEEYDAGEVDEALDCEQPAVRVGLPVRMEFVHKTAIHTNGRL